MNKKADVYRLITFPVLITIISIMALFVLLSAAATTFNGPGALKPNTLPSLHTQSFLIQTVTLEINSEQKEMILLDAVIERIKNELPPHRISSAIAQFVNSENSVALIATYDDFHVAYLKDGNVVKQDFKEPSQAQFALSRIGCEMNIEKDFRVTKTRVFISGKEYEILSYYGDCKDE